MYFPEMSLLVEKCRATIRDLKGLRGRYMGIREGNRGDEYEQTTYGWV
jgi:hypothetical protein